MNQSNHLLASIALFKQLLESKSDIYDVLATFLKNAIYSSSKFSFNSTDLGLLLQEEYGFNIPESVVKSVVRNKMGSFLKQENNVYVLIPNSNLTEPSFATQKIDIEESQELIISDLVEYIEEKENTKADRDKIREYLRDYYLGKYDNKMASLISSFIIEKSVDTEYRRRLNYVKEGLIIYTGLCSNHNLNELGSWNSNLTIYLDTEILFSMAGFNGSVFKKQLDDFLEFVRDINGNGKTSKQKIKLKFFQEVETQFLQHFTKAEKIVEKNESLDPTKTAMKTIVEGCKSTFDVLTKKANFISNLTTQNIHKEDEGIFKSLNEYNDVKMQQYNVVAESSILNKLTNKYTNSPSQSENNIENILKQFTRINFLRRGDSRKGFENTEAIILTGKRIVQLLSYDQDVKVGERDIPFATNMDFIIEKFWFKLKKGFNKGDTFPKSFDMVSKAQIVLSHHTTNQLGNEYEKLKSKVQNKEITQDSAIILYNELKKKMSKPEDITPEKLEDTLNFLNDSDVYENFQKEQSQLQFTYRENEKQIEELKIETELLKDSRKNNIENFNKVLSEKEKTIEDEKRNAKIVKLGELTKQLIAKMQVAKNIQTDFNKKWIKKESKLMDEYKRFGVSDMSFIADDIKNLCIELNLPKPSELIDYENLDPNNKINKNKMEKKFSFTAPVISALGAIICFLVYLIMAFSSNRESSIKTPVGEATIKGQSIKNDSGTFTKPDNSSTTEKLKCNFKGILSLNGKVLQKSDVSKVRLEHDSYSEDPNFNEGIFTFENISFPDNNIIVLIVDLKSGHGVPLTKRIPIDRTKILDNTLDLKTVNIVNTDREEISQKKQTRLKESSSPVIKIENHIQNSNGTGDNVHK